MRISGLIALLLLGLSSSLFAGELTFSNFARDIHLVPEQGRYVVAGSGQRVQISNRLIVQALPALKRDDLLYLHPAFTRAVLLFSGQRSQYFVVDVQTGADLQAVMQAVSRQPGIGLVQPDILQLANRADAPAARATSSETLSPALTSLWQRSKGRGVKIAIIDDGFDLAHAELSHVGVAFSYDAETRQLQAQPLARRDNHGTRVAGVLFAAHDGSGLNGVAPEAELIAIRQPDTWTSNTLLSFHLAALAGADVINCGWTTDLLLQPVADVVQELAQHGRNGKGIAVVFAAGNEGRAIAEGSSEAAIADAIVVAAGDASGQRLPSSNFGASVDLTAFGGSVESTAIHGGYARLGGTSLASAIVSGLAALLISADPERDLDELLTQLKVITPALAPVATAAAPAALSGELNAGL